MNIPANNCAILQKNDDLELLPAGQHYITNPNVTVRGLYTLGENQLELPTKDMYVLNISPVAITVLTGSFRQLHSGPGASKLEALPQVATQRAIEGKRRIHLALKELVCC